MRRAAARAAQAASALGEAQEASKVATDNVVIGEDNGTTATFAPRGLVVVHGVQELVRQVDSDLDAHCAAVHSLEPAFRRPECRLGIGYQGLVILRPLSAS